MRLDSVSYQMAQKIDEKNFLSFYPLLAIRPTINLISSRTASDAAGTFSRGPTTVPSFKESTVRTTHNAGMTRMSLKEFLRSMASKGEGVEFHDGDPNLIKIPWIHASKKNWRGQQHCKIFIEWAKNTGKSTTDAKKCKANFRCALNSLKDVKEVPELSKKNGNDGYRVFRILMEKSKSIKCTKASKAARKESFQSFPVTNDSVFESPPVSPDDDNNDCMDFDLFALDYGIDLDRFGNACEMENGDPSNIPLHVTKMQVDDDDTECKQKKSRARKNGI